MIVENPCRHILIRHHTLMSLCPHKSDVSAILYTWNYTRSLSWEDKGVPYELFTITQVPFAVWIHSCDKLIPCLYNRPISEGSWKYRPQWNDLETNLKATKKICFVRCYLVRFCVFMTIPVNLTSHYGQNTFNFSSLHFTISAVLLEVKMNKVSA